MFNEFLSKAGELLSAESPFAVAIVIRREPPVSGKPGDKAIIQSDGKVWGWIGGGCVQPSVIREALNAMEEGSPRLVRIAPSAEPETGTGTVHYPMSCHGGGALEVYIEPVLAKPRILIFGRSPAAQCLAKLGKAVGYGINVVARKASRENFPDADSIGKELVPGQIKNASETYIVVATQGEHDEEALEHALSTSARYISFIASHAKAQKIIGFLAEKGIPEEMLRRIKAPEIIQVRKGRPTKVTPQESPDLAGAAPELAPDPVCGMMVDPDESTLKSEYNGRLFYFCCAGCQQTFEREPEKYL
jgi:xanthine dehydrogenase accessory factor